MKKIFVAFLLSLTSFLAHAQKQNYEIVEKPVFCSTLKIIVEAVSGEFGETPTWRGNDDKSKYVMTVNQQTGTWTMIQYNDQVACVVGFGRNSKTVYTGKSV